MHDFNDLCFRETAKSLDDGIYFFFTVVNRLLVEAGAQPLTNLVDGYDENGIRAAN